MKITIAFFFVATSCAIFAQEAGVLVPPPSQIIPASQKTASRGLPPVANALPAGQAKPARRARMPRESRRIGNIPGIVTIPLGKTASGARTHIYRVMGQGGVVMDFTDYGARPLRAYAPDATGALVDVLAGSKFSILEYEKAGDISPVWKLTPVRRPRATGLVFTLETTNAVPPYVTHWLDANNVWTMETSIADTNAVKVLPEIKIRPLSGRSVEVKTPVETLRLFNTTNVTTIATRPTTNRVQKLEFRFLGIKSL